METKPICITKETLLWHVNTGEFIDTELDISTNITK